MLWDRFGNLLSEMYGGGDQQQGTPQGTSQGTSQGTPQQGTPQGPKKEEKKGPSAISNKHIYVYLLTIGVLISQAITYHYTNKDDINNDKEVDDIIGQNKKSLVLGCMIGFCAVSFLITFIAIYNSTLDKRKDLININDKYTTYALVQFILFFAGSTLTYVLTVGRISTKFNSYMNILFIHSIIIIFTLSAYNG